MGNKLDANGWVDVDVLLEAVNAAGHELSSGQLEMVVRGHDKRI